MIEEWKSIFEKYLSNITFKDSSHDLFHFKRVWSLAKSFSSKETDQLVVLAACYFHDIVSYPKNDKRRSLSSVHAAKKAQEILLEMQFPLEKIDQVKHCIEAHSFSANIETLTEEARIVQDADRIESLGAIGLARTFYVAGRMGSQIFNSEDPFAKNRELDDSVYAVDHFKTKLLQLPETMKTDRGRNEAISRAKILQNFLIEIEKELQLN